ncbi:hypothetical protein ACNULB_11345 [Clostridium perfringens]|uniref:hypothetical protein n=1 Tax=Clostridium perfringens TaxID=1502 RepID=UPI003B0010B2
MKIFKTEIKRAIFSKLFLISIGLGILSQGIGAFLMTKDILIEYYQGIVGYEALDNMLSPQALWYFSTNIYVFIIPLIACIPYSLSFLNDINNEFIIFIKSRTSLRKYINAKIFTCFISGFLAVFVSSFIFFLLIYLSPYTDSNHGIQAVGALSDMFLSHQKLYLIIYIFICSFMGGAYSLIALAISTKIKNPLIVLITPTIYYYVATYVFGVLNLTILQPATVNQYFRIFTINSLIPILGQIIFYILICILIIKKLTRGLYDA